MAKMTTTEILTGIKKWVLGKIGDITALIPSQASAQNQLADKGFVNSSIATATATFRGTYNLVTDLGLTTQATRQQIASALATKMAALGITPDTNDYAFVQIPDEDETPTVIESVDRYKYSSSAWGYEYSLNNSGFTAAQWAAINSGATLELMGKLSALPTNSELATLLNGKAAKAQNPTSGHLAALDSNGSLTDSGISIDDNGAYDVTAHNSGTTFASLSALLSDTNLSTLIPADVRKGGMSIKFVQTSDNKYAQCRLIADEFTTDTTQWAICEDIVLVESPEFVEVKTDNNGRILWGIRTNGTIFFGAGCPPQVVDYIQQKINELSLDEYEDIVTFLNGLEEGENTLSQLLNDKVNKETGKSLIQSEVADKIQFAEAPEFLSVEIDSDEKVIAGRKKDGTKFENMPIDIPSAVVESEANPEWLEVTLDNQNKIIKGIKKSGKEVSPTSKRVDAIEKSLSTIYNDISDINSDIQDINNYINSATKIIQLAYYRINPTEIGFVVPNDSYYINHAGVLKYKDANGSSSEVQYESNCLYVYKDLAIVFDGTKTYELDFNKHYAILSGIILDSSNIFAERPVYPVLWGVKYSNNRNKANGYGDKIHPEPIGWLYYDKDNPTDVYYSHGIADNPKKLFEWNTTISDGYTPTNYSPIICNNGDIICVFRNETVDNSSRRNPIIYKHGDYENPVEINVNWGQDNIKPSGWQSNQGMLYLSEENIILFGEYTRPYTEPANVWKVTYPFDVASNWNVVMHTTGTGEGVRQVEHFHTVDIDMFTGNIYLTSGDTEAESKIWYSSDNGDTWTVILEDNLGACRCTNMIITKDKAFFGSDEYTYLNIVERGQNGLFDFSTLQKVTFPTPLFNDSEYPYVGGRTYYTCLIDDLNSILLLQRNDSSDIQNVGIHLYNIDNGTMKNLRTMYSLPVYGAGFRCNAATQYQSACEKRLVFGFNFWSNRNDIVGNKSVNWSDAEQMNNIMIEIK